MGLLRTLLALCVVAFHSTPILGFSSANGVIAVEAFYIISGFYMALILSERYRGNGTLFKFYENRILRLFPIYWIVLALTIAASIALAFTGRNTALTAWTHANGSIGMSEAFILVLTNVFLVGQDVVQFFGINTTGHFYFDPAMKASLKPTLFIPVSQAWTLGVELLFYIFVPFLNRLSNLALAAILFTSFIARYFAYHTGFNFDPWNYRFFPFELGLFVAGMLSHRFYTRMEEIKSSFAELRLSWLMPTFGWGATAMLALYVINYSKTTVGMELLPDGFLRLRQWYFLLCFVLLLPFIFDTTNKSRIDDWIGSLSYPIYICHGLFFGVFAGWVSTYGFGYGENAAVLSILTAMALVILTRPIEKRRRRNRMHAVNQSAIAP